MSKFAAEVIEDDYERGEFWLRVTHNGASWSAIRLKNKPEMLAVAETLLSAAESPSKISLSAELVAQTREIERLRNEVDFMLHEVGKPSKYETDGTNSGTMCLDYELK